MAKQPTKHVHVATGLLAISVLWLYGIVTAGDATFWTTADLVALGVVALSIFFLYKHNKKLDNILALFLLVTFALSMFAAVAAKNTEYIHMDINMFWGLLVGICAAVWTTTAGILLLSREA
ncbi:MAG: hypothetical protein A3F11_11170 [Gammaproteobacteria bacterium RIFCSPHIGHO2_12_FULL_37_14]|nr:MAG: hypothetical protein A3F11_11170 [Gammaproteobacteria bacterium RIFCSPHIGHO2_12_FULL_37_14]